MSTLSRIIGAGALVIGFWLIGIQGAVGAQNRTILVFGDSLSAAHGLRPEQGWVALLQKRLRQQGYAYEVINASISGETTSGGLQRLPRTLRLDRPDLVILELGANDGLRGLPVATARKNLAQMIRLAQQAGARVLLVGVRMPPNYGPRYTQQFDSMYRDLARQFHLTWVPHLLAQVAGHRGLFQADGLHPTGPAEPLVLDTVWAQLAPLLRQH